MVPFPEFSEYRNLLSELTAISRLPLPVGFTPTTVAPIGVSAPPSPMENPAIVDEPAFETYTQRPLGVTVFQQFAFPSVGTPVLMGEVVPFESTEYEEIVEALLPPAGPVSEISAAPFG